MDKNKVVTNVNQGLSLLWLLTRRTFYFAAALLFVSFYGATAETTVFSLSQPVHTGTFWVSAVIMAVVYHTFVYFTQRNK